MVPDWTTSIIPRKCDYCGKRIKRKTPHIAMYGYEIGVVYRYCDPHCARMEVEREHKESDRMEELIKTIYGGHNGK